MVTNDHVTIKANSSINNLLRTKHFKHVRGSVRNPNVNELEQN